MQCGSNFGGEPDHLIQTRNLEVHAKYSNSGCLVTLSLKVDRLVPITTLFYREVKPKKFSNTHAERFVLMITYIFIRMFFEYPTEFCCVRDT